MRILISGFMLLAISFNHDLLAHAEPEKPRFVAVSGADSGRCHDHDRPCKTISYAAQQAGKGDEILVAQGLYNIESEQDLFYLVAQAVPVLGGYSQVDHYQQQKPAIYLTTISGIPAEFADQMNKQGFKTIRDTKQQGQPLLSAKSLNFNQLQTMQSKQTAVQCVDGFSATYPCQNISLLAHVPLTDFPNNPGSASDIWGHIDLNTNQEYALLGLRNGISVIDVSTPEHPVIVDTIAGLSSTWRDIKVYQFFDQTNKRWKAYAYATTEANEGLMIIDLSNLPAEISLVRRQTTDRSAHNIYISNVDYGLNIALPDATPSVHIVGSENFGGALRSYSLRDPEILEATFTPDSANPSGDYTHDASSVLISDSRAQTECPQADEIGCLLILDFNEKELRLWDHSNENQSIELSSSTYPNAEYTHSGWWSEDKQFVIVHDELDEQRHTLNTTLNIFDISSLTLPIPVGTWTGPTRAIDHNGYVRGNRYYMSNYERGLTILDISDPATPVEVGYFDTYPVSDNAAFNGAWGVYPFLPSGTILVSDINSGLYILKDETLQSDTGSIAISSGNLLVNEGETIRIQVNKSGSGSTRVGYEVLPGSATVEDFTPTGSSQQSGELSWASGDTQAKFIELKINTDFIIEASEIFFIRLFDPRNGATLTAPNITQVKIAGLANRGTVSFTTEEFTVKETDTNITIPVSRIAGFDEAISVNYQLRPDTAQPGEDAIALSGSLIWQDGDASNKTIEIDLINDELSEQQESLLLVLSATDTELLGTVSQTRIIIRDDESNLPPVANAGNDSQVNTSQLVQLNGTAEDPEQEALEILWQQVSGETVTLNNANTAQANFTAPNTAGTLTFSLTVTDDFAITAVDNVSVSVVAPPPPQFNSSGGGGGLYYILLLSGVLVGIRLVPIALNRHNRRKFQQTNQQAKQVR